MIAHYVCVVAKRKTLFDDRPVEISVRRCINKHLKRLLTVHVCIGIDIYHQARHRQIKQADCHAARLYKAPKASIETGHRTHIQCRSGSAEQAGRHIHELQGCLGDQNRGEFAVCRWKPELCIHGLGVEHENVKGQERPVLVLGGRARSRPSTRQVDRTS